MTQGILHGFGAEAPHAGRLAILAAAIVLGGITPAWADVGLPMIVLAWPVMGILFIPIVLIEWAVARRLLSKHGTVPAVLLANLVSTAAGIPLTWLAIVAMAMLTGTTLSLFLPQRIFDSVGWIMAPFLAAWLPGAAEQHVWWIPVAFLGLLIPFFFASVWIERRVMQWFARWPREAVVAWSWRANALSYLAIALVSLGVLGWVIVSMGT